MKEHELKCWPESFRAVWEGRKKAEIRLDDRGFAEGDTLWLREWDPATEDYSGRWVKHAVTHVLRGGRFGLAEGHVMLSLGACLNLCFGPVRRRRRPAGRYPGGR
jgi:hypothetical protein